MNADILGSILALMSLAGAGIVLPRQVILENWRALAIWGIAALAFFLLKAPPLVYLLVSIMVLVLSPLCAECKVALYVAVAACLPFSFDWQIPFPGINFLLALLPAKTMAILLLLPALFATWRPHRMGTLAVVLLIAFSLYGSLLIGAEFSATATIRFAIDQFLVYALPYAAILCALRSEEDVDESVNALIVASVILAFIALFSTLRQWNFYLYNFYTDERGGFIRVIATANNHSLGMHLAVGLLLLEAVRERLKIGFTRMWTLRFILLAALFFTGSRGAQSGFIVGAGLVFGLIAQSLAVRRLMLFGMIVGGIAAAYWLVFGEVSRIDETGNFAYRQELLRTTLAYLSEHPFFGDFNFARSGRFDHLLQGQNIIDITNYFLQIALYFGLIGFVMVFTPFIGTGLRLISAIRRRASAKSQSLSRTQIGLFGSLVAWAVTAATTSDIGITVHVGLVVCALGHAAYLVSRETSADEMESAETLSASPVNG
ncbi:MAG: hypothetical protein EKK41_12050 [Hyphomicrobiales bacterium]|nr:MAG: hypothetical protein EKK41_12050 [Hyphomicrobiales bacterium]